MKKIYIVIAALMLSAGSFAQTADSLLRRQMELERDFTPPFLMPTRSIHSRHCARADVRKPTNYSSWAAVRLPIGNSTTRREYS
jgi:hypothetical protein